MATTLGSTKLLRGSLNQGMSASWIGSSSTPRLFLPDKLKPHSVLCSATSASHSGEQCSDGNPYAKTLSQRRRELPWQLRSDESLENGAPVFGAPSPQRTPWDQGTPPPLANKSNRFPGTNETTPLRSSSSSSHMLNIVEKLRAIERKQQQGRSFSTYVVPNSPSVGEKVIPEPPLGSGNGSSSFPWQRKPEETAVAHQTQPPKLPCLAELTIPDLELRRLQRIALRVTNPIKVGYLGVTKAVIQEIHRRWQRCEVVKVKCDGPAAINMKQTHDELETKTGGLVIWRTGGMAVVYRGKGYFARVESTQMSSMDRYQRRKKNLAEAMRIVEENADRDYSQVDDDVEAPPVQREKPAATSELEDEYMNEIDALLDELGPRYDDWIGTKPVPVDGDLLPAAVRGFKPPLRLLPYRAKANLSDMELTVLRKLAKPLPPHFVLGRNRGLQGLAAAILKLWQKSEIAKIGLKRGVQNTRNQLMAEELERLTGGKLISRDKFFIVFYRGKDFLPASVATVLKEREFSIRELLEREERVRSSDVFKTETANLKPPVSGSLGESLEMKSEWDAKTTEQDDEMRRNASIVALRVREQKRLEAKLATAIAKKRRADLEITKLEQSLKKTEYPADRESITDEERYMFRKLGLRMDAFLLIGRRGVFDGVIENMHLHWKHRELVKLILKEKDKAVAMEVAKMLELESGGVLVAVATTSKGQAIVVYRGKNYQRPAELRPRTLLTKRKALARSKELQRKTALQLHIDKLETLILKLRKDYDYLLKSNSLPETPHSALYKDIDSEYKEDDSDAELLMEGEAEDSDGELHLSDLDSQESGDSTDSDFSGSEAEEPETFRTPRDGELVEDEDESEWDLESEDEEA